MRLFRLRGHSRRAGPFALAAPLRVCPLVFNGFWWPQFDRCQTNIDKVRNAAVQIIAGAGPRSLR